MYVYHLTPTRIDHVIFEWSLMSKWGIGQLDSEIQLICDVAFLWSLQTKN